VLSEHLCQGWLEGYLLTGRHGLFNCYEAFIHIVDSMFNQHAKWLKVTRDIPWRRPIASLNYLLSSTSGARTTTASRTRTRASSTTS
jgi:xylulose-5-phosphate/fructose-6-phosphate phosphoketolase